MMVSPSRVIESPASRALDPSAFATSETLAVDPSNLTSAWNRASVSDAVSSRPARASDSWVSRSARRVISARFWFAAIVRLPALWSRVSLPPLSTFDSSVEIAEALELVSSSFWEAWRVRVDSENSDQSRGGACA